MHTVYIFAALKFYHYLILNSSQSFLTTYQLLYVQLCKSRVKFAHLFQFYWRNKKMLEIFCDSNSMVRDHTAIEMYYII